MAARLGRPLKTNHCRQAGKTLHGLDEEGLHLAGRAGVRANKARDTIFVHPELVGDQQVSSLVAEVPLIRVPRVPGLLAGEVDFGFVNLGDGPPDVKPKFSQPRP